MDLHFKFNIGLEIAEAIHKAWVCINENMIPSVLRDKIDSVSLKREY